MCGIVGVIGNINLAEKKAFRDMHMFSVTRGFDSAGIFAVDLQNNVHIHKTLGLPGDLWDADESFNDKGIYSKTAQIMIGHNRWATFGKVTVENAHPFDVGNIVGLHNGTLINTYRLEGEKGELDSLRLLKNIQEKGVKQTWEILDNNDAAAVVYLDKEAKTLNIIRNNERELWYAMNEAKNCMFIASESWMIRVATSRNDIKLANLDADKEGAESTHVTTKVFPADKHHEITTTMTTFAMGVKDTFVQKEPPKKYNNYGEAWADYYNQQAYKGPKDTTSVAVNSVVSKVNKEKINLGWANGTIKGDKEFRDLLFQLKHYAQGAQGKMQYYVGKFLNPLEGQPDEIYVYPNNYHEVSLLRGWVNDKSTLRLMCRPRLFTPKTVGPVQLRTEFRNVKKTLVMENNVIPFDKDKALVEAMYPKMGKTDWASKMYEFASSEDEHDAFLRAKRECQCCNNPLDEIASVYHWFNDGRLLVCEDCLEDEIVTNYLGAV